MHHLVAEGYYGMGNAGDDAFCLVTSAFAREAWGVDDLAFVAPQSRLPALPFPARGIFPDPVRFRGHGRTAALWAKLRARHVAHVGGSVFQNLTGRQRDEEFFARLGLLRLHAIGVSVGPFKSAREGRRTVRFLRRFHTLHVRDQASAGRIAEVDSTLNARVGFDVAVLLPELAFCRSVVEEAKRPGRSNPPVVGVSVCNDASLRGAVSEAEEQRHAAVVETLRRLAAQRAVRYRFIAFNSHPRWGDEDLTRRIADAVAASAEVEVQGYDGDVRGTLAAVAGCDAIFATRLHAGVFAYACQVPFVIVAYRSKGRDFAREVGLPDRFVFPVAGPQPQAGCAALAELLDGRTALVQALLPLDVARRRARAGFDPVGR